MSCGSPRARRRGRRAQRIEAGSATVNLLSVAGIAALAVLGNHGREFDVRQTTYASREDCLRDWGTEESCSATQSGGGTSYVGPRYYWDAKRGTPMVIGTDGAERVATDARIGPSGSLSGRTAIVGSFARGGFGGIGRGFNSGRGG